MEKLRDQILERMKEIRAQINSLQEELDVRPKFSAAVSDVRINLNGLLNQVNDLENRVHSLVVEYKHEDTKTKD